MDMIKEMFQVGAHFGYSKSRSHPSTRHSVFGFKNRSAVIDLEKTKSALARAADFARELGQKGKILLLVGTKDEAKGAVETVAENAGLPYVNVRWLGGTLTNWSNIKGRVNRLVDLKTKRENNELSMYTKKERLLFDKEIARLERYVRTLIPLTAMPGAVFMIDSDFEAIAVAEAQKLKIPVISLSGSDCNVRDIAYPVIANDANVSSIRFFLDNIVNAYLEGKKTPLPVAEPVPTEAAAS